ncbi:hypothetical protein Tco_1488190 [Tanacetum coccineum]
MLINDAAGSDYSVDCAQIVININYIGITNKIKAALPLMRSSVEVNVGVEHVVQCAHGQGCSDGTFSRPDKNIER